MLPTSIRPGRIGCPCGQRSGGRTIHCPDVDRTNSPMAAIPLDPVPRDRLNRRQLPATPAASQQQLAGEHGAHR